MREISNHLKGDTTIDSDTNLHGMLSGNILVTTSSTLNVHGMINGDVTVNEKATLNVNGTVNGNIINDGLCNIFGVVNGKLVKQTGRFHIDSKAKINDNLYRI